MQKKYGKIITYGFLTWLIPFIIGFLFYTEDGNLTVDIFLFKSIMLIVGTTVGSFLLVKYFKKIDVDFVKEAIYIGFTWFILNILLDILILIPMSDMSFSDYFSQIGIRYLNIPIISIAIGKSLENKEN